MEELLNQIGLPESAIKIYLSSMGRPPLSSFELYSIVSDKSEEAFNAALNELIELGLLIPIPPQNENYLMLYFTIPPFNPIIKYYANIKANLDNIKEQLRLLLINSLKKIFSENKIVELDTIYEKTHEMRNDYQDEVIIQKQEIDDIVIGMENLNVITNSLAGFYESIKSLTQTHFAEVIKFITNMKNDILQKVELLELKKYENDVKYIIEQVFKDQFEKLVETFIPKLHKEIENEFNNTLESLKNIVSSTFQLRNDFKMLLLNMLNSFENNFNIIMDNVKEKKEKLPGDLEDFEDVIINNFDLIIKNSVESVTALNNPIEKAMKNYFKAISSKITDQFDNLTIINSVSRVNETIKTLITKSKNDLTIVVPKLDDHINVNDFEIIRKSVKVKVVSSEPHTNSTVKKLKANTNLEYRTLLNDSLILIIGDNQQLLIGIIDTSKSNKLQDFIGFNTNFIPFIKVLEPIIKNLWSTASTDLHETPKSIAMVSGPKTQDSIRDYKPVKAIITDIKEKIPEVVSDYEIKSEIKDSIQEKGAEIAERVPDLTQKFQQQINFSSKTIPKSGDTIGLEIDTAFNILANRLPNLKGEEFSEELEKIAELILEKKGFSVTLHKIRSKINQYKTQISTLSQVDINHITESINEWKAKLI